MATPLWAQEAIVAGLRTAMMPLVWAGPEAAMSLVGSAGPGFARLPFNGKRLKRTADRIAFAFPGWDRARVDETATLVWRHLGSIAVESVFTPHFMTDDAWAAQVGLGEVQHAYRTMLDGGPVLTLTGHIGNFDLAGTAMALLGLPIHALFRPLDFEPMDRWVRRTREVRGMRVVTKHGALRELPDLMASGAIPTFVADQNAGDRGVFVPFFGRLTSSYKSVALLAMSTGARVVCGGVVRTPRTDRVRGSARMTNTFALRVELSDVFGPEDWEHQPDPVYYITARYRRALETLIRRYPDQYFWMHNVWKSRPRHERQNKPMPASLREKLGTLPWLDEAGVAAIVNQSDQDRAWLAERGVQRLV